MTRWTPLALLALTPALALAQPADQDGEGESQLALGEVEAGSGEAQTESGRPIRYYLEFGAILGTESDLNDGDGSISVSRVSGEGGIVLPILANATLTFSLGEEVSFYDFDSSGLVPGGGDPIDTVYETQINGFFTMRPNLRWTVFAGGQVTSTLESGADFSDSVAWGVFGGATYNFSETFSLGGGALVRQNLEDGVFVIPTILLRWQIAPRWTLSNEGLPGLQLTYKANDELSLFAKGQYEYREFRLAEDGLIPSGIIQDQRVPVTVGVIWSPNPRIEIVGGAGLTVWNRYETEDSGGNNLAGTDADPSLIATLKVTFRF